MRRVEQWEGSETIRYTSTPILFSLLVGFTVGSACPGQTIKDSEERIKVSIAVNHREFHLGDPIELNLEISNFGRAPILIANSVSLFGNSDAFLEIELRNRKTVLHPHIGMAVDCFPVPDKDKKPPSEAILKSFLVLRPGTSYVQRIPLHTYLRALDYGLKPGNYTLAAYYSSNGLLYPSMCGTQGLTEDDVKSLPFETWHGKVGTNEISFTIMPRSSTQ